MERRQALKALGSGAAVAAAATTGLLAGAPAAGASLRVGSTAPDYMTNMGMGIYVDGSTANQMSTFSIAPKLVTCGVGTVGVGPLALSGPFAMLMYSVRIDRYQVDSAAHTITAAGRMRSITMIAAGLIAENVEHDFVAVASNGGGLSKDRFDVHFVTPFWDPAGNPMAARSALRPGWARFGGYVAASLDGTRLGGVNA